MSGELIRCSGCKWWVRYSAEAAWGECRRYPPQRLGIKAGCEACPSTWAEHWCGEAVARVAGSQDSRGTEAAPTQGGGAVPQGSRVEGPGSAAIEDAGARALVPHGALGFASCH